MITNSPEREDASVDDDGRHKRTARLWSGVAAIQPRSEVKFWEFGGSERKGGDVTTEAGDVTTEAAAAAPEIEASVQTTEDIASVDDDGIIAPGIEAAAVQTTEDVAIIAPEESEAAITDDAEGIIASEIEAAVEDDIVTDDAEGIIELTSEDTEEGAISVDDDGRKKRNGTLMTGTIVGKDVTSMEKMWNAFIAIGNIAFAYNNYPVVAIRIQDTLRSGPPENKVMKKGSLFGISAATIFFTLIGVMEYAAFGNDAPGNFIAGFGFYEPYWLIDLANVCVVVHLTGAYQVYCQPLFAFVERWTAEKWPNSAFINGYGGPLHINCFKLVWRTAYVLLSAVVAMAFPFFTGFMGLIGSVSFWPLMMYFPVELYIAQSRIPRNSFPWIFMKLVVWLSALVLLLAAAGSVQGILKSVKTFVYFNSFS